MAAALGTPAGIVSGGELDGLLLESRTVLGKYLNADADHLVYSPNATRDVNIVADSLQLKPGREILTTDHEYGARDYTWDFICGRAGTNYIHQSIVLPVHIEEATVTY